MSTYLKAPDAVLDYAIDWAAGYLDVQTLTTSAWSVMPTEPGGLAVQTQSFTTTKTTATMIGGVAGHLYHIANHVVFSDGRAETRSLSVRVELR